nr:hypothetical protein [Tanacetum cinerariifolium]
MNSKSSIESLNCMPEIGQLSRVCVGGSGGGRGEECGVVKVAGRCERE